MKRIICSNKVSCLPGNSPESNSCLRENNFKRSGLANCISIKFRILFIKFSTLKLIVDYLINLKLNEIIKRYFLFEHSLIKNLSILRTS